MPSSTVSPTLCLNMIVRNEARIIERCLQSVAGHIGCWVICDTGSTDETPQIIEAFFRQRNIPGELHHFSFENFEQARNQALDCALASALAYDYLLLADADMELQVLDPGFCAGLSAAGYEVLQKTRQSYWNVRMVQRDSDARYHGVTHEYLSSPDGCTRLAGIRFIDHADGSSRKEKYPRDVALLERDVAAHPDRARSWFYLAQSYRDMGAWEKAAAAYRRRIDLGGWAEEKWYAGLQLARCLLKQGDEPGFLSQALIAWNERPQRAEPLYDLARYHRDRALHAPAILFAEAGMRIPLPEKDQVFIEDWVYDWALREEYSIAGYYVPGHRERAAVICNELALDPDIGGSSRRQARRNLEFYAQNLAEMVKSFVPRRIEFEPLPEWRAVNPSVVRRGDELYIVQQMVNHDGDIVRNRNVFWRLDHDFAVVDTAEILPPVDLPPACYDQVLGFENMRPFIWKNEFWAIATLREQNPKGWREIAISRLREPENGSVRMTDYRVLHPEGRPAENPQDWVVALPGDDKQFLCSISPSCILDMDGRMLSNRKTPWAAEHLSGGSQAVAFGSGWLTISHEHIEHPRGRHYLHRFLWFDRKCVLQWISPPFSLARAGGEFVAGLAWHPDGKRLIVSFGVDAEPWVGSFEAAEIAALLAKAE